MYFPLFSLLIPLKTLNISYRTTYEALKNRKRQTSKGPQSPRNHTVMISLGFLSASYIPDLELKKLATWKCNGCSQTKPKQ